MRQGRHVLREMESGIVHLRGFSALMLESLLQIWLNLSRGASLIMFGIRGCDRIHVLMMRHGRLAFVGNQSRSVLIAHLLV